ncbi:serine hydrolase [Brevundimonas sp.]|uniref:serine hydrolase n=1 Tax=Brevundimonas sp. TaxID=1871086 RepID=UPI0025BC4174|nr:serine hydrolase [Brevundimonas sp.]
MRSNLAATALAAAILLVVPAAAGAQDRAAFPAAMDAFARRALARTEAVPGMAVAVVDQNGAIYTGGVGVADVASGAPVDADTRFYIASATKSFTALAIAAMAGRGEVDLEAPLAAWSPDSGVPADIAGRITLTDLLSHRSGVENGPIAFRAAFSGDWTPALMWDLTAQTRPRDGGGYGTFAYTNSGYNLATVLMEHERGRDWRALVQGEVLTPLGMTDTTAFIDEARAEGHTVAAGHFGRLSGQPERSYLQKTDATMQSAGGLVSTAHDMAIWLEAQVTDGTVGGGRVLPAGLIASTHASRVAQETTFGPYVRTGYGLGWQVGRYGDDVLIHHFGNFSGSRAHVSFMPERHLGVAVMVNEDAFAGELADLVANYAYDWFANLPDVDAVYDAKLAELVVRRDRRREGIAGNLAARAQRPRTLSLPNAAYVGDYVSPAYGTLSVSEDGDRLRLTIGVQSAVAENFTDPESLRVELTPYTGQGVTFRLGADGRPVSLDYDGDIYTRR